MIKDEMNWLHSSKCKYCGCELEIRTSFEKTICRNCGRTNYRSKKIEFQNRIKKKILKEKRNRNEI